MLMCCEGKRPFPAPSRFTGTAQIFGKKDPAEGTDAEISLPILSCFPPNVQERTSLMKNHDKGPGGGTDG